MSSEESVSLDHISSEYCRVFLAFNPHPPPHRAEKRHIWLRKNSDQATGLTGISPLCWKNNELHDEVCPSSGCSCSVAQSCLTLWDPMDYSTPGFPVLHYWLKASHRSHQTQREEITQRRDHQKARITRSHLRVCLPQRCLEDLFTHAQLRPTLCDLMDCSPPGSYVHGILLARIMEWVGTFSFKGSSWTRGQTRVSYVSCIGRWVLYLHATWDRGYITTEELTRLQLLAFSRNHNPTTLWANGVTIWPASPLLGVLK